MWLLFLVFLFPLCTLAQSLKPGVYQDLKADKPIVLDTGSYIGLVFKSPAESGGFRGLLDARKAPSLTLVNCRFEGKRN